MEKVIVYYYRADLATVEGRLDQLIGQAQQHEGNAHFSGLGGVLPRVRVRDVVASYLERREHLDQGVLGAASDVSYDAKVPFFPLKLACFL